MEKGNYLLGALSSEKTREENELDICKRFIEIIQSSSAEDLKNNLLRTEFNFESVCTEITFSFPSK